jgi:exosome complex component RRP4
MIQTIEQATHTRVLIGQNGVIVVTGRNSEGINLAVRAIRMVEEEAHTPNLTQRVKTLLNVSDSVPADGSQLAQPQNAPKNEELQPHIQEGEEELDVEKGENVP